MWFHIPLHGAIHTEYLTSAVGDILQSAVGDIQFTSVFGDGDLYVVSLRERSYFARMLS